MKTNKFIMINIRPFIYEQNIKVYDNDKCIREVQCPLEEISGYIEALIEEMNVKDINIGGDTKIYADRLKQYLYTKYKMDELNVTTY